MIRTGLIGCGTIAAAHLGWMRAREDVRIVALCDANREAAQKRADAFGGEVFTDFEAMLDQARLDAVWLCTPPHVRREPLLACADRGIPVFCEKPVEKGIAQARAIAAELGKRQAKVQVGYVIRPLPVVRRLREEMADDRIHIAQSVYLCDLGLTRGTTPPWLFDKAVSGGPIVEQGTHNIDLLRYLFGEAGAVRGLGANPLHPRREPDNTSEETVALSMVFGPQATMVSHLHSWVSGHWLNELVLSGENRLYRLSLSGGTLTVEEGGETRTFRQDAGRGIYDYENDVFIEQVKSGDWGENPSSFADAAETLALCLQCDEAISRAGHE